MLSASSPRRTGSWRRDFAAARPAPERDCRTGRYVTKDDGGRRRRQSIVADLCLAVTGNGRDGVDGSYTLEGRALCAWVESYRDGLKVAVTGAASGGGKPPRAQLRVEQRDHGVLIEPASRRRARAAPRDAWKSGAGPQSPVSLLRRSARWPQKGPRARPHTTTSARGRARPAATLTSPSCSSENR